MLIDASSSCSSSIYSAVVLRPLCDASAGVIKFHVVHNFQRIPTLYPYFVRYVVTYVLLL